MAKKATKKEVEKFKNDFQRLREMQSNEELARKLDIDPGNLSSYSSGGKIPGKEVIDRFNKVFEVELDKLGYSSKFPSDDERLSEVDEAQVAFLRDSGREWFDDLKVQNEHLRSKFDKIVETNQTLAESNKNMSQSNLLLAETNQKLVNMIKL